MSGRSPTSSFCAISIAAIGTLFLLGAITGCRAPSSQDKPPFDPFLARRPSPTTWTSTPQVGKQTIERLPPIATSSTLGDDFAQQAVDLGERSGGVRLATHDEPAQLEPTPAHPIADSDSSFAADQYAVSYTNQHTSEFGASGLPDSQSAHPIDLANALALGGASSLQIQLAREKTIESEANLLKARAMWLPSLRFGLAYTRHDGQIQATEGPVIHSGRNSLFFGGFF